MIRNERTQSFEAVTRQQLARANIKLSGREAIILDPHRPLRAAFFPFHDVQSPFESWLSVDVQQ